MPSMNRYQVYGLRLRTSLRLPCPRVAGRGPAEVECYPLSKADLEILRGVARPATSDGFAQTHRLPDGAWHARLRDVCQFFVSPDGRHISWQKSPPTSWEALHCYLLGLALSYSLVARGLEPLHATAVAINGQAVGFLGNNSYGKSTLAAAFLRAGYPLLTDDVLVLRRDRSAFVAFPGIPRLKLFPSMAARFLPGARGTRMNHLTHKQVFPVPERLRFPRPLPLHALYVLGRPGGEARRVRIARLAGRRALLGLLANAFNDDVLDKQRLARQFRFATQVLAAVPVRTLSYPRNIRALDEVIAAVTRDLARKRTAA